MSYFPDASIGQIGAAPPTVATFVGGTDGTDLRGLAVDSSGKQRVLLYDAAGNALTSTGGALNVNLSSGLANPLPTTDAADGATGAAVPSKAIQAAGSDGTNLRAVATDTSGRQKVLLFDSAGTAIVLVSGRVPVDGSGVTQPISAASLPLPTGASTAAKQPALGVAGTPSADVLTVQGHASMTAIDVNIVGGGGSGGTAAIDEAAFTAGTSLFTPGGGVFNDAVAALTSGQQGTGRVTPNRARHVNLRRQDGTEIGVAAAPLVDNVAQVGGTAIDTNSGNKSAGTQRVVLATDQPLLTNWVEQATYSDSVIHPHLVGNKVVFGNLTSATSITLATGAPGYYVTGFRFDYNQAEFSPSGTRVIITLVDSVTGNIAVGLMLIPATAATTFMQLPFIENFPNYFWNNKTANSVLTCHLDTNLTAGGIFVTVTYGLCSFVG